MPNDRVETLDGATFMVLECRWRLVGEHRLRTHYVASQAAAKNKECLIAAASVLLALLTRRSRR